VARYDVIAVDIDGTLVDSRNEVPRAHEEALRRADRQGVRIVLASGRMIPAVTCVAADLGLTPAPCVGYNGGRVVDAADGRVLFHAPVPADLSSEIVRRFHDLKLHINYYLDDVLYVDTHNPWGDLYATRTGSPQVEVGDLRQFDGECPTKLLVIGAPDVMGRLEPEYRAEYGDRLYVTLTVPEYLEFMHPSVSKATGVAKAAEALGVPRERVAAVGDAWNDQSMIQWAGLGCAMGGAPAPVRAAADVVAPSCDDDGLAWFVNECVLG